MKELQHLMDWDFEFAQRVFPEHCFDPVPPLHHLKEEIRETIEELETTPRNPERVRKEYADCLILLVGSAARAGLSAHTLIQSALSKMAINEKRNWGTPDANGVYHHKKEPEESNCDITIDMDTLTQQQVEAFRKACDELNRLPKNGILIHPVDAPVDFQIIESKEPEDEKD